MEAAKNRLPNFALTMEVTAKKFASTDSNDSLMKKAISDKPFADLFFHRTEAMRFPPVSVFQTATKRGLQPCFARSALLQICSFM